MLMHNPPHPGAIIKELCLDPLGLSVTDAARALGVSLKTLSCIINGKKRVSARKWLFVFLLPLTPHLKAG